MAPQLIIVVVLYILALHFLADFVFQSNWMASNKSKNTNALNAHVFSYTLVLFLGVLGLSYYVPMSIEDIIAFCIVNYPLHWITDYLTSRLNTKLWNAKQVHWFFVSVGFDQMIHFTCLLTTFQVLVKDVL